jgi:hypothetical protein
VKQHTNGEFGVEKWDLVTSGGRHGRLLNKSIYQATRRCQPVSPVSVCDIHWWIHSGIVCVVSSNPFSWNRSWSWEGVQWCKIKQLSIILLDYKE